MRTVLSLLFCLMAGVVWADEVKLNIAAPAVLPGVTVEMRSPGFWAARHPSPDELVLSDRGVQVLNRRLAAQGLVEDLSRPARILPGSKVREYITEIIEGLKKRVLYAPDGKAVSADLIAGFDREVSAVPEKVEVLFGFTVKPVDQRLLPVYGPLYAEPGDVDFDELQNSRLDINTPVTVLAHSRDRKWLFVRNAISSGWLPAEAVARATYEVFIQHSNSPRRVIVTSARADLFLDPARTEYLTTARMGAAFTYKSVSADYWGVEVPAAGLEGQVKFVTAYIPKKDASSGPLAFTPRVIYDQAFKLLDAPYGWGDMNGGQDCSRFLQMVFGSVGIILPRNSAEQGKVGTVLAGFKEQLAPDAKSAVIVAQGLGGAVILRLQGHIVLYLGSYKDQPYVIHSAWAYREPLPDGTQRARVIGRVAVTSLDLGAGSAKGSLLQRIISARILR
ncbi:MAG: SH3 domain-containing protein [Candidatus Omnitrophica bacterium]|nr:SH3 domain-containing protein [Candidatus Omnitrophota bacterium]